MKKREREKKKHPWILWIVSKLNEPKRIHKLISPDIINVHRMFRTPARRPLNALCIK